jgi:hypothetical protein
VLDGVVNVPGLVNTVILLKPPAIPVREAPLPTNEEAVIVPVGVEMLPDALIVVIARVPAGEEILPVALNVPVAATPVAVAVKTVDPLDCKLISPEVSPVVCKPPTPVVSAFNVTAM